MKKIVGVVTLKIVQPYEECGEPGCVCTEMGVELVRRILGFYAADLKDRLDETTRLWDKTDAEDFMATPRPMWEGPSVLVQEVDG